MAYKKLTKTIIRNHHNRTNSLLINANNERIIDIDIFADDTIANVYTVSENHVFYRHIYYLIDGKITYQDCTIGEF